jgi:DNA-binding CsgD family transcriptional regulator
MRHRAKGRFGDPAGDMARRPRPYRDRPLRGSVAGHRLTEREHDLLYWRALRSSIKETCAELGLNWHTVHGSYAVAFEKLGVEDIIGAFRAMGWLKPVPYGVRSAEVTHERLDEEPEELPQR